MGIAWAVVLALTLARGSAHPMHTAVAEVVQEDPRGAASVRLRVFADDLGAAVALPADPAAADSAMAKYLRGTFALADRHGRATAMSRASRAWSHSAA